MVRMYQDGTNASDDANDEASGPLGIEAEVEVDDLRIDVDVWRLSYAMA